MNYKARSRSLREVQGSGKGVCSCALAALGPLGLRSRILGSRHLWKTSGGYLTWAEQIPALFDSLIVTGKGFAATFFFQSWYYRIQSELQNSSIFLIWTSLTLARISVFSFSVSIALIILYFDYSYFGTS